jgi:MYXO-CTERM domain-containing protein
MRFGTRTALVAAASLFAVTGAHAASPVPDDFRSSANAPLKWATREPIFGPTSDKVGASLLNVEVGANLDPVADPVRPLLAVDMPSGAQVEAQWYNAQTIDLVLVDALARDAIFRLEHTLAPHMRVNIDAFGFKLTYDYNAENLIDHVPGSNWNYVGAGFTNFDPWGFKGAPLSVKGPELDQAQLFSVPLPDIGGSNPILEGNMALNATTSPNFQYRTTLVTLMNGTPINASGGVWQIPTTDADYLDVSVLARGEITYSGTLYMRPSVNITKIGDFVVPAGALQLEIGAAGVQLPYQSADRKPIAVEFPQTVVHIPLPNVKAQRALDLGEASVGDSVSQRTEILNTGEMKGSMIFESSDPQFTVVAGKQFVEAKEKYLLEVRFTPTAEGPQSAQIKVLSNDPNEPIQIIRVVGNGGDPNGGNGNSSGCGCKTAPSSSDAAGFAAAFVALAAMLRRRRR